MKKNKIVIVCTLFVTALFLTVACEDKDPLELVNDAKPLVVQANDFNLSIDEGTLMVGDTLGTLSGTSNKGTVNFELQSQTPSDAIAIDASSGVLTVVNPDSFLANTQVTGVAAVLKDGITENLNIAITVDEVEVVVTNCTDPVFNINTWLGNVNVEDVGFASESIQALGSPECNQLILAGELIAWGCAEEAAPQVSLTMVPDSEGATTGAVFATSQPWDCDGSDISWVFPTGSYDEGTGEISVDYEFYIDGELVFPGQFIITPNCDNTANTALWAGDLDAEDVGFGSTAVVGTAGCGTLTIDGEILAFGCTEESAPQVTLTFIPDGEGATSGSVFAPASQAWDCDGSNASWLFPTGTYDETTGEILVDYEFYVDGELLFPGQFLITPQE